MKKIFYGTPSQKTIDISLLILRCVWGFVMIPKHGLAKLSKFDTLKHEFMNFLGLGSTISLSLAIFAELFCSLLLILGLYTRLATIPLLITMIVIMDKHEWVLLGKYESVIFFFVGYILILLLGPGKYSLDHKIQNRR